MDRQTNIQRHHFANLKAVASMLSTIPQKLAEKIGFNLKSALRSYQNSVSRYYGTRSKYSPHQGEREKLRRRIGGFYTLHKD